MAVSLQKGQKVSLSKENPGLSRVIVGLGWDEAKPAKRGLFGFGARTQAMTATHPHSYAWTVRFRTPRMSSFTTT